MNVRRFVEVVLDRLDSEDGWATIDRLMALADDAGGVWTEEDTADAVEKAKKAAIRNVMRTQRDAQGRKVFHSIERRAAYGTKEKIYKHTALLTPEERVQVAEYHTKRVSTEIAEVIDQAEWYSQQTGKPMPFPLELRRLADELIKREDPKAGAA